MPWKGLFKARNPQKYAGNADNIVYRSQIELRFMNTLDTDPTVIHWASEEFYIPYYDITSNRQRRYYPDFLYKNDKDQTFIIEIKCEEEARVPVLTEGKTQRRYRKEMLTYAKNRCKWNAANEWCQQRGFKFLIITEKMLGMRYG